MPRKTSKWTAYHEAGHAVIARVLDLTCGSATIIPNESDGEAGHSICADPWRTVWDWDQRVFAQVEHGIMPLKYRGVRAALRGRIIAHMAGAEAERELLGRCRGGGRIRPAQD